MGGSGRGFYELPDAVSLVVTLKEVIMLGQIGPRPDQAHFSLNYIDELRQLIDAEMADKATKTKNSCIALGCLYRFIALTLHSMSHGAKLPDDELPPCQAYPLLLEKQRAGSLEDLEYFRNQNRRRK